MKRHAAAALVFIINFGLLTTQASAQDNLPQLVKKIQPAVVTIIAYDAKGKPKTQGSGFFISPEGHFSTNYHVLSGASRAILETADGERYPVKTIVGKDSAGDLIIAVADDPFAAIGRGSLKISPIMPEVGERVVVIGSPLGLEQTLSDGVVSAGRKIDGLGEIIQITAPVSPGSSGSPVVNMKGKVIGVATLQMIRGQNLNFAVPGSRVLALQQRAAEPAKARPAPAFKSPTPSDRKPAPFKKEPSGSTDRPIEWLD